MSFRIVNATCINKLVREHFFRYEFLLLSSLHGAKTDQMRLENS